MPGKIKGRHRTLEVQQAPVGKVDGHPGPPGDVMARGTPVDLGVIHQ